MLKVVTFFEITCFLLPSFTSGQNDQIGLSVKLQGTIFTLSSLPQNTLQGPFGTVGTKGLRGPKSESGQTGSSGHGSDCWSTQEVKRYLYCNQIKHSPIKSSWNGRTIKSTIIVKPSSAPTGPWLSFDRLMTSWVQNPLLAFILSYFVAEVECFFCEKYEAAVPLPFI